MFYFSLNFKYFFRSDQDSFFFFLFENHPMWVENLKLQPQESRDVFLIDVAYVGTPKWDLKILDYEL